MQLGTVYAMNDQRDILAVRLKDGASSIVVNLSDVHPQIGEQPSGVGSVERVAR
jgi:hypothetical protein